MTDPEQSMRDQFERIMAKGPKAMIIMADCEDTVTVAAACDQITFEPLLKEGTKAAIAMMQRAVETAGISKSL